MGVTYAYNYPDALASTSLLGPTKFALLLVDSSDDSKAMITNIISKHKSQIYGGWILGGTGAVAQDVEDCINNALK